MVTIFFSSVFIIVSATCAQRMRKYRIFSLFILGASLKLVVCLIGIFATLPFSGADAINFQIFAERWSDFSFFDIFGTFDLSRSYNYSSLLALLYKIFEINISIPVFVNGILGVLISYNAIRLFTLVHPRIPIPHTFLILLLFHPMLNVNSGIVLRENFIIFFLLHAATSVVRYTQTNNPRHIFFSFIYSIFAAAFHGAMIIFPLGIVIFSVFNLRKGWLQRAILGFGVVALFAIALTNVELAKLAVLQGDSSSIDILTELDRNRSEANTRYLQGLTANSSFAVIWQLPIRCLFFLLKPFPWDVQTFGHALAFVDSIVWVVILYIVTTKIRKISLKGETKLLLICVALLIIVFAFGTSNFGTAIRHRTKVVILLLILVAPYLPKLKLRALKFT